MLWGSCPICHRLCVHRTGDGRACFTCWEMLVLFLVLSSAFCGTKVGSYHVLNPAYSRRAVDDIVERSGNSDRVRHDGTVALLNLHRVDIFEYTDMAALSRIYVNAVLVIAFALIGAVVLPASSWNSLLGMVAFSCLMPVLDAIGKNRQFLERPILADVCGPRPSYRVVRCFLLLSGLAYAVSRCFSPGPFLWRWGLIVTHSTRLLNLLVSLRGQHERRVDAAAAVDSEPAREQIGSEGGGSQPRGLPS